MKVAFIFDTVLVEDSNQNFYGMTLNYEFLSSRYLTMFSSLIVTTRAKHEREVKGNIAGYKIVNGQDICVMPIREYNTIPDCILKRKKIKEGLQKVILSVDKVIIRMPSILGIIASDICKKENKEYIIEMVACPWDGYMNHTNPIGKLIAPIMYWKTKRCVKMAPKVLYVTKEFLQKRYPTRGEECACSDVVLNSIAREEINDRIEKIEQLNCNSLKLCTVANVGMKYKGHKYVFDAISLLKKQGKNYQYFLIGNGDRSNLLQYAKKLGIEKNVIFLGSLPHSEVFQKLKEMDLYIQPSLQEGLPRALIEAMSIGMPAIGSNVGGIPELLDNNMIFRKKNDKQLYSILDRLNKETMIKQIHTNYNKSLEYLPEKLNKKRVAFYMGRKQA